MDGEPLLYLEKPNKGRSPFDKLRANGRSIVIYINVQCSPFVLSLSKYERRAGDGVFHLESSAGILQKGKSLEL